MISIKCYPHDRVEFGKDEVGPRDDLESLPWVQAGVGRFAPTRLGLELRIGPYVGRIVIPERVSIEVEEPFPGTVATCLDLTMSGRRAAEQESPPSHLKVSPWSTIATIYERALTSYLTGSIERRYMPTEIITSRPRGKINIPLTATRLLSRGRSDQLICVPRVLTEDTPLNRALSAAAIRVEQILLREGPRESLWAVRSALIALSGVRRDVSPDFSSAWRSLDFERKDHQRLLSIAEVIVKGVPALPPSERQDPAHPMTAWLNVELLFEDAVRTITQEIVGDLGHVRAGRGDGIKLLGRRLDDPITANRSADPDIVVTDQQGVLLMDAKYRRHDKLFTDSELYQLISHATAYQATAAALVAPTRLGQSAVQQWIGRDNNGTAYYVILVDPASTSLMYEPIADWLAGHLARQ